MAKHPDSDHSKRASFPNRWLALVLTVAVVFNLLVMAAYRMTGTPPKMAFARTGWSVVPTLFRSTYNDDSFGPMGRAYLRFKSREDGDIYGLFFDDHWKFQYPPTSLLIFKVLPDSWLGPEHFEMKEDNSELKEYTRFKGTPLTVLRIASQLAILISIAASVAILEIGIRRVRKSKDESMTSRVVRIGVATVLGLTFFPLMKAHELGQIQVFLNALTALGVLAHLLGWRARSGVCLGICCLIKPQYAVLVIWGLIRRHWRFLAGFLGAVVPLGLTSLAVFGWTNHLRYIEVIRTIARSGETYWANQCFNGFANRLLGNGDPIHFSGFEFAPYNPLVHGVTVATSLLILGLALFRRRKDGGSNPTLDLAVVIASATLASPIAWEHHYGAFLPLFALALPACLQPQLPVRILGLVLGFSFLAMGVAVLAPDSFFSAWWRGWAASHLFYGAVSFFGLLLYLRNHAAESKSVAAPATVGGPVKI